MKPIHPMLVHFPISLLTLSVSADLVAFFLPIQSLRGAGWWSLLGAATTGIFALLAGVYDMRRAELVEELHERVHRHMRVGIGLITVIWALAIWGWFGFEQADLAVTAVYLDCAILATVLAGFQGWLGGELVYTHGVFVRGAGPANGVKGEAKSEGGESRHVH